jgi:4'-phosphopantetheinyl transferase
MRRRGADRARLRAGEIHVWTARLVNDRRLTAGLLPLLNQEEQARAAQLSFRHDRMRFIQAHGSVRQILCGYLEADAASLTFARGRNGKPSLVPQANDPTLHFSVSHSSDCCMVAVRLDQPIGIDVERLRDLPRAIAIAQTYFAPAERRALNGLRGTVQRDAFFTLWTHKEAAVKALGVGLAANLARLEFDLDAAGSPRLAAWGGDQAVAQSWSVLRLTAAPGYVAALATAHPIGAITCNTWTQ